MATPDELANGQVADAMGFTILNWIQLFCVILMTGVVIGCVTKLCMLFKKNNVGEFIFKRNVYISIYSFIV